MSDILNLSYWPLSEKGIEIKVETQGGMGIDNELEQDEIDEAVELAQN